MRFCFISANSPMKCATCAASARPHSLECNLRIGLTLRNAVHRGQLPENLDTTRGAVCMHAYINGLIGQWLLVPDSFQLHQEAERWVDAGLDMLRLSPSLRN